MKPETKRQHFVNCSYLANWDLNRPKNARKAIIYWTDGEKCDSGSAEDIGFENFLYKRSDTQVSESYFGEFERDWPKQYAAILSRKRSRHLMSGILVQAVVLHLRNPRVEVTPGHERFELTVRAVDTLLNKILIGQFTSSLASASLAIQDNWEFRVFRLNTDGFITSDNPCVLMSYRDEPLSIVYLPVSPKIGYLAVRKSTLKIFRSELLDQEVSALNSYVTANARRMVYSYEPFSGKQISNISDLMRRNRRRGIMKKGSMRLNALRYPLPDMALPVIAV